MAYRPTDPLAVRLRALRGAVDAGKVRQEVLPIEMPLRRRIVKRAHAAIISEART